jgi:hypothetical protein
MMKQAAFISLFMLLSVVLPAQSPFSYLKLNTGLLSASPGNDLGMVSGKGRNMLLFLNAESPVYGYRYTDKLDLGLMVGASVGIDKANFLSNDVLTQIDVNMLSLKAHVYPFYSSLNNFEFIKEYVNNELLGWLVVLGINSLHIDLGSALGTLNETAFIDEFYFKPDLAIRPMLFTGWGLQPQLFQTEDHKWTIVGVFDAGKYVWVNRNGGLSSIKTFQIGFGASYSF